MIQGMKVGKELVVVSQNRVGVLSEVAGILAAGGVNIVAISAQAAGGVGLMNLMVSNAKRASSLLSKKGFSCHLNDVLALQVEDRPGVLMKIAKKLSAKKVDIFNVYGSSSGCCSCILVLSVSDARKAYSALK